VGPNTITLLVLSSLVNAGLCVAVFWFAGFATAPDMQDATVRLGYYVLNGICVLAAVGAVAPWALARAGRNGSAVVCAVAPAVLLALAVIAFFLLDSWLRRTLGA
jgi:hypothetical protein